MARGGRGGRARAGPASAAAEAAALAAGATGQATVASGEGTPPLAPFPSCSALLDYIRGEAVARTGPRGLVGAPGHGSLYSSLRLRCAWQSPRRRRRPYRGLKAAVRRRRRRPPRR